MREAVEFFELGTVPDEQLAFAVVAGLHHGRWVLARHRDRRVWELPGGHREPGESILDTARRELFEETGAVDFHLEPVCLYAFVYDRLGYGLLCLAHIRRLGPLPQLEMAEIRLFSQIPKELRFPTVYPAMVEEICRRGLAARSTLLKP